MPKTPEQHTQLCFDSAARWLQAADTWKAKKQLGWEAFSLYHVITAFLTIAVKQYPTPIEAALFLTDPGRQSILDRVTVLTCEIYADGDGSSPDTPLAGIDSVLALVHLLWLLERFEDARHVARLCDDDQKLKHFQFDRFWRDYSRAIAFATAGKPFTPEPLKVSGYQQHWQPYVLLFSDITNRRDISTSLAMIDVSFAKRKKDKRLINGEFDGDGTFPVQWDFRRHSILNLGRNVYGL